MHASESFHQDSKVWRSFLSNLQHLTLEGRNQLCETTTVLNFYWLKSDQNHSVMSVIIKFRKLDILARAVAILTILDGQDSTFLIFSQFWSILAIFPRIFLIFFLILAEGPGYPTDISLWVRSHICRACCCTWSSHLNAIFSRYRIPIKMHGRYIRQRFPLHFFSMV